MDEQQLKDEGIYQVFGESGSRTEMPIVLYVWVIRQEFSQTQQSFQLQQEISQIDLGTGSTFFWHLPS